MRFARPPRPSHRPLLPAPALLGALALIVLGAPVPAAGAHELPAGSSVAVPSDRGPALAACGRVVDQAVAGAVPSGTERWGLTREGFGAALAAAADPAVPDGDLRRAVRDGMLRATPWLEEKLRLQPLDAPRPYLLDATVPRPDPAGALLFRCTIRDDGRGWTAYELQLARPHGGGWIAFPLTDPEAAF